MIKRCECLTQALELLYPPTTQAPQPLPRHIDLAQPNSPRLCWTTASISTNVPQLDHAHRRLPQRRLQLRVAMPLSVRRGSQLLPDVSRED